MSVLNDEKNDVQRIWNKRIMNKEYTKIQSAVHERHVYTDYDIIVWICLCLTN